MSAPSLSKRYTLRQPCNNCPFRTNVQPYLRPERAQEIARALRDGGEFPCHKTSTGCPGSALALSPPWNGRAPRTR